jgi:hypothetical protein
VTGVLNRCRFHSPLTPLSLPSHSPLTPLSLPSHSPLTHLSLPSHSPLTHLFSLTSSLSPLFSYLFVLNSGAQDIPGTVRLNRCHSLSHLPYLS